VELRARELNKSRIYEFAAGGLRSESQSPKKPPAAKQQQRRFIPALLFRI
jgi:hypothetical protein